MNKIATALTFAACVNLAGKNALELSRQYPVSLVYDGAEFSAENWTPREKTPGIVSYISPDGKLALDVEYRCYPGYPVVEIIPYISCVGQTETRIVENWASLHLVRACDKNQIRVRRTSGSITALTDFTRHDALLQCRHECDWLHITSDQESSSATWLPYFGVDVDSRHGLEIAVGWTGPWRADMQKRHDDFGLNVGLDGAHFKLLPGERYLLPTILVMERVEQTVADGLAVFHRFLLDHKAPRDSKGRLFQPWMPASASGGNKTDENMLRLIDFLKTEFPGMFNVFWVDANWYGEHREIDQRPNCGPGWGAYVGDWRPNTWAHPDGNLKKISDAAHAAGMKFLVWFEPERATSHAPIVKEHPEYFLRWKNNPSDNYYLLDLGNPEARKWITGEICRNIEESGIDIYRQDCNWAGGILRTWRDHDTPERTGIHEIKHVNGLYAFWDDLRHRYPDMLLENCAGGGRRMDYQMMSRSHSYCRDDAHMAPNCDELTQNITLNSTAYIPITGGETFTVPVFDDYAFLSRLGAGTVFTPSDFQGMVLWRTPSKEELDWFRRMFAIALRIQPYFMKDFYALTDIPFDSSELFCAYQCNDPERSEGFFAVFRRKDCAQDSFQPALHGIDPKAEYTVEVAGQSPVKMTGAQLASWNIQFDAPRTCRWVFYKKN